MASLHVTLQKLSEGLGVRRPDLYAFLGSELRALWGVHDPATAQATVIQELERHISALSPAAAEPGTKGLGPRDLEFCRAWLRCAYYIQAIPGGAVLDSRGKRRDWFNSQQAAQRRGPARGGSPVVAVSARTDTRWVTEFARQVALRLATCPGAAGVPRPGADGVPPPVPAVPPRRHRHPALVPAAVLLALALLAGLVILRPWQDEKDYPTARDTAASSGRRGAGGAAEAGAPPQGDALNFTLYSTGGRNDTLTTAFSGESARTVSRMLAGRDQVDTSAFPPGFERALEDHGYLLEELHAHLAVQQTAEGSDQIDIYNVEPVAIDAGPVPTDLAIMLPSAGGGGVRSLDFYMDQPSPTARRPIDVTDPRQGRAFFDTERITFTRQGEKEILDLNFFAFRAAYSFRVAVDYERGGKKFRQYVTDANGAARTFRVSADLCPQGLMWNGDKRSLADAVATLEGLQYGELWLPSDRRENGEFAAFAIERAAPSKHTARDFPQCGG